MRLSAVPRNALVNITDDMELDYCKGLGDVVRSFSQQVEATTLPPIHGPGHNLRAGDWIVVWKHVRTTCLELCCKGPFPVRDEGGDLQEGDGEPISMEATGEPGQRRAFPETDDFERQKEQLLDPEGEGVEPDQRRCYLTPPEPVAGPSKENTTLQGEAPSSTLKRTMTMGPL
ncbi:hypothetical protein NDU88_003388 [Pleurodeles waltl]|uniref:Uncharacterized protein n=1 Tax=Pleurodeles waltl TaxID=8319 RepID=A0AAV7RI26_PLEWA|nr:hypothetical protein NDU88_003388 [Pleurodeles waltl]